MPQDALGHLFQIGLALAQVLILHFVELAADHFELGGQGPFGVVEAFGHPMLHTGGEGLVLEQHEVHIQQGGQLLGGIVGPHLGQALLQPLQFIHHRVASHADAVNFFGHPRRIDEVMGHIDAAGCNQHGAPDGNASGHSQAMDGECHGCLRCWGSESG